MVSGDCAVRVRAADCAGISGRATRVHIHMWRAFLAGSGGSPCSSALVVVGFWLLYRPREVVVKFLLVATVGCRVEDLAQVLFPEAFAR